jgi:hypothetical protein
MENLLLDIRYALRVLRESLPRSRWLGVQIAICPLLVSASLVAVRGMLRLLQAPLGFRPQGRDAGRDGSEPGRTGG